MNRRRCNKFKFSEGERVLCFEPDVTKARVLYDAKVLETQVKKDAKGKKSIEYLIHFQGWNSSWDRYVAESFILQDIQEHRLLQKELADAARTILKENRRTTKQRIGALRGADPKFRTDSESSSVEEGDSGTRSSFEEDSPECDNNLEPVGCQDSGANENVVVTFTVPDSIKQLLEEDGFKIKSRKKWVKLPCHVSVATILDGFLRHYATTVTTKNPEKSRVSQRTNSTSSNTSSNAGDFATTATQLTLCKEFLDGLRVSFDFLVGTLLLYAEERPQYEQIKAKQDSRIDTGQNIDHPLAHDSFQWRVIPDSNKSFLKFLPCTMYGVVHLCRLLVKLPEIIQKMHLNEEKRRIVTNFSELLLLYIDKNQSHISESDYVTAAKLS
ncbi:male-specific lethal 3 homolog isoform X1 [Daphnia carinata]|uniref:male-specific lethal 3 homolog isoform X1 n=1 Tax=Daphnia carinata TaxID=120202 RepID=UPI00257DEB49|nr:male-specific lethal 3 homolog isoform X1 [Daphnia carinata]